MAHDNMTGQERLMFLPGLYYRIIVWSVVGGDLS